MDVIDPVGHGPSSSNVGEIIPERGAYHIARADREKIIPETLRKLLP
jgi:hypothetical protein